MAFVADAEADGLFGLDGAPLYPQAYEYYRAPSFENARRLLEAFGLYVPYAATRAAAASGFGAPGSAAAAPRRGGGTKRPRASPDGAPPGDGEDALVAFRRADFLHDVHVNAPVSPIVVHRVLATGEAARIPDRLRQRLREHCASRAARAYTDQATATLDAHFALSPSLLSVSGIRAAPDAATPTIRREHVVADAYMRDTVARWLAPNAEGVAEIVFDGILDDPIARPARKGLHDEAHLRSLAACAFLQWMIGEWPAPFGGAAPPREIRFLTGTFQTLDVAAHDAFFKRWLGYLRREATALKAVAALSLARLDVADVRSGTPGVALAPNGDAALIANGRRVPFVAAPLPRAPPDAPHDPLRAFSESPPARQVTYAKADLALMFQHYLSLTDAQRADARVDALVDQVIAVNAFRDAFKADVALARGAAYVTVDRLALVYHELRRRALGAAPRGLAMVASAAGGGTMALKAYRASARGGAAASDGDRT